MKTREYWAVRYSADTWVSQVDPVQGRADKKRRYQFKTQREALEVAAKIVHPPVCLVKVTRKPKAPPPLKVGDEVLVRATFKGPENTSTWVRLQCPSGAVFSVYEKDIARGPAK